MAWENLFALHRAHVNGGSEVRVATRAFWTRIRDTNISPDEAAQAAQAKAPLSSNTFSTANDDVAVKNAYEVADNSMIRGV